MSAELTGCTCHTRRPNRASELWCRGAAQAHGYGVQLDGPHRSRSSRTWGWASLALALLVACGMGAWAVVQAL